MHGAARQDAGTAASLHHPPLRDDILTGVLGGQLGPEPEAAGFHELPPVEEQAPADPGDPVGEAVIVGEAAVGRLVSEIRRVVQPPPLEALRAAADAFRFDAVRAPR